MIEPDRPRSELRSPSPQGGRALGRPGGAEDPPRSELRSPPPQGGRALGRPGGAVPRLTVAALTGLVLLEILWELVLAPLPSARWLAVKALPLAILLPGVARGARKPRQWLALLTPFYFAEALGRALTEPGRHALVAGMAAMLALVVFVGVLAWLRRERTPR